MPSFPLRSQFRLWLQPSAKDWRKVAAQGEVLHLVKGQTILPTPNSLYFLQQGLLLLRSTFEDNWDVPLCIITPDNIFNEVVFFNPHHTQIEYAALTQCTARVFSRPVAEALLAATPLLYKSIATSMAYKASLHVAMRGELRKKTCIRRNLCALFFDIAAYYRFAPIIKPMLTQTDIASLLNVDRSRVSRECAILQKEGIIGKYSQTSLEVLDYERLLLLAGRI